MKGKDMILSDFLSRQKHNDNMYSVLQERYYKIVNSERYLVQTQSQAKSSGIKLTEVHGISKSLNPNVQPEKQVTKPLVKEISQIKPGIGQRQAGSRWKKPPINHPLLNQQKTHRMSWVTKIHVEVINILNFTTSVLKQLIEEWCRK